MGAGRVVMGLAAAAALAVIWKKKKKMMMMLNVWPEEILNKERKKRESQQRVKFMGEIPSDIWAEILARLPVKLVIRSCCVCKEWYSLTDDAAFRELHCKRALDREPHTIFVPQFVSLPGVMPLYESGPAYGQLTQYSPHLVFKHRSDYWRSNPVNGLVVAYLVRGSHPYSYYLLNPATRELSPLPASNTPHGSLGCRITLGFDASTGKYKLVRLIHRPASHYYPCEILTIGTQEWRSIGETPCAVNFIGQSVFLNGAIYWMAWDCELPSMGVLAFDIKDEKFRRILSSVPFSRDVPLGRFSLYQFGGQIFLAESPRLPYHTFLRIWTLEDDDEGHEWKQKCNLNMSPHSNVIGQSPFQLLGFKDGKLMMQQSLSIYSYDLQSNALEEVYSLSGFYEVGPLYSMAESFISPRSLTDASAL